MARMTDRSSRWGAWLDSTLDRVGDAAVFSGIALWYAGDGDSLLTVALCLYCLSTGAVVSYARARAEGLGMTANVGITERADRPGGDPGRHRPGRPGRAVRPGGRLWLLAVGQHGDDRPAGAHRPPAVSRRDPVTYWLYAGAWAVVRRLPERVAYRLFDLVADLVWRRRPAAVLRLEANLRRARPEATPAELRALSRAGLRSYLRYWCDVFRLPDWSHDRVVASVRVVGEEHLRSSTGDGKRGVVGALMHMGNWDHAGAWASLTDVPVVTVAERLQPSGSTSGSWLTARGSGWRSCR
jgi:hypothetical protein